MKYQSGTIGRKIYLLRVAKEMTQEELASVLCVSAAAVSKWERNQANPSVEMLWTLADFFECSIDELVGREKEQLRRLGSYDEERLRLIELAEELHRCCELCRREGFLALDGEMERYAGSSRFLPFAVRYFLEFISEGMQRENLFALLHNYVRTLPEQEWREGDMIVKCLEMITAGESPEILRETIASYVGMEYRSRMENRNGVSVTMRKREEILDSYRKKTLYSERTNLLELFETAEDSELRAILRNVDNVTLAEALYGASGKVVVRFLANLSERLLRGISEDIDSMQCPEAKILRAQRRVLELSCR